MTPTITSERLLFRPYVVTDEEQFVSLLADARVSQWMGDGPRPETEVRALFRRVFEVYADNRFDCWAVFDGDTYVGHAEIKPATANGIDGHADRNQQKKITHDGGRPSS